MKKIIISLSLILASFALFAQGTPIASFQTHMNVGDSVQVIFTAWQKGEIKIDFGSGTPTTFSVNTERAFLYGAIGSNKEIKVYGDPDIVKVFSIYDAKIYKADISGLTKTMCIGLGGNELTEINLEKNAALEESNLYGNRLTKIDYSKNPKLRTINCTDNQIESLDLTALPNLEVLTVNNNKLTGLDLSKNPKLNALSCTNNEIAELDLSQLPELGQILCSENCLHKLDISKNPKMRYISCSKNYLKLSTLPLFKPVLTSSYIYAPQKDIDLGDTVSYIDFGYKGHLIEGFTTEYTLRQSNGKTLIRNLDYVLNDENGVITFKKGGLEVFVTLSNKAFPKFTGNDILKTEFFITKAHNVANETTVEANPIRVVREGNEVMLDLKIPGKIMVFNMLGQLQQEFMGNSGLNPLHLTQRGAYIARIYCNNQVYTQKFIF